MGIQRRKVLRETARGGRTHPQEVPRPCSNHRREGAKVKDLRSGQAQVSGTKRPHSGPVLLPDPQANSAES